MEPASTQQRLAEITSEFVSNFPFLDRKAAAAWTQLQFESLRDAALADLEPKERPGTVPLPDELESYCRATRQFFQCWLGMLQAGPSTAESVTIADPFGNKVLGVFDDAQAAIAKLRRETSESREIDALFSKQPELAESTIDQVASAATLWQVDNWELVVQAVLREIKNQEDLGNPYNPNVILGQVFIALTDTQSEMFPLINLGSGEKFIADERKLVSQKDRTPHIWQAKPWSELVREVSNPGVGFHPVLRILEMTRSEFLLTDARHTPEEMHAALRQKLFAALRYEWSEVLRNTKVRPIIAASLDGQYTWKGVYDLATAQGVCDKPEVEVAVAKAAVMVQFQKASSPADAWNLAHESVLRQLQRSDETIRGLNDIRAGLSANFLDKELENASTNLLARQYLKNALETHKASILAWLS